MKQWCIVVLFLINSCVAEYGNIAGIPTRAILTERWSIHLKGQMLFSADGSRVICIHNGIDNDISAYDATNGRLVWKKRFGSEVESMEGFDRSLLFAHVKESNKISCFNIATGALIDEFSCPSDISLFGGVQNQAGTIFVYSDKRLGHVVQIGDVLVARPDSGAPGQIAKFRLGENNAQTVLTLKNLDESFASSWRKVLRLITVRGNNLYFVGNRFFGILDLESKKITNTGFLGPHRLASIQRRHVKVLLNLGIAAKSPRPGICCEVSKVGRNATRKTTKDVYGASCCFLPDHDIVIWSPKNAVHQPGSIQLLRSDGKEIETAPCGEDYITQICCDDACTAVLTINADGKTTVWDIDQQLFENHK